MHPRPIRTQAAGLRAAGCTWSEISRHLGVSRSTLRTWAEHPEFPTTGCPRCDDRPIDTARYAALLGFYLGDGCISAAARYYALRVSCDRTRPGIIDDIEACIRGLRPHGKVFRGSGPGVVIVTSNWRHWPCLFPQHGPGRKHLRPIILEDWQRHIVEADPGAFLRGLFHSDGCRITNTTKRPVLGGTRVYCYPRWQFTNVSGDIRELCCWALETADIAWRRSNAKTISVSRREAVARLDSLIGPKS